MDKNTLGISVMAEEILTLLTLPYQSTFLLKHQETSSIFFHALPPSDVRFFQIRVEFQTLSVLFSAFLTLIS